MKKKKMKIMEINQQIIDRNGNIMKTDTNDFSRNYYYTSSTKSSYHVCRGKSWNRRLCIRIEIDVIFIHV